MKFERKKHRERQNKALKQLTVNFKQPEIPRK